jgi:hypothetical protein
VCQTSDPKLAPDACAKTLSGQSVKTVGLIVSCANASGASFGPEVWHPGDTQEHAKNDFKLMLRGGQGSLQSK